MSDYTPCPECGSKDVHRERSPDGETWCSGCMLSLPHDEWQQRVGGPPTDSEALEAVDTLLEWAEQFHPTKHIVRDVAYHCKRLRRELESGDE